MSYHAEYAIDGTASTMTVTDDEVRGHCTEHGHLVTINPDEYAFPAAHVERVARLHHSDECITETEAKMREETVTVETLTDEAPRRTEMSNYINPDEAYDTFPVVKALKSMDDEALRRRIQFILDGGCAGVRDVDGRLYQYSILITRERLARRLDV